MPVVTYLRCEGLITPLGIGTPSPKLSWEISGARDGAVSVAWRLEVKGDDDSPVWDSGIVTSSRNETSYAGSGLMPRARYRWRVMAVMADGVETTWSDYAFFECGFFDVSSWPGYWINYNANVLHKDRLSVNHMRGEFVLTPGRNIARARAFVAATGPISILGNDAMRMNLYELRINGRKAGSGLINPGQLAVHSGRALFRVDDIAALLQERNAVGLIFAAGKISVQIFIDYHDGAVEHIGCGPSWRWTNGGGPYKRLWRHDVKEYGGRGEMYDARCEYAGWDMPGFDDSSWKKVFPGSPPRLLAPQTFEVEAEACLPPVSVKSRANGDQIVSFARVINGYMTASFRGRTGEIISLRYAEKLRPDGEIDCTSTSPESDYDQIDYYTKKSDGVETYTPSFATHSFRYVQVHGSSVPLEPADIKAISITAKLPSRSSFTCSDERINRLHRLCDNTFKANMVSVPTDCPGRERNGWTADAYLVTAAEFLNFDARHLYKKWFTDISDMQEPDGYVPYVCPFPFAPYGKDIVWAACAALSVGEAYEQCGDAALARQVYPMLKKLGDYLASFATSGECISDFICFGGDHIALQRPSTEFMGYAYCFRSLMVISNLCRAAGMHDDAVRFETHARAFRATILSRFRRADGTFDNGTQSAGAHALHFGIVGDEDRAAVLASLAASIDNAPPITSGMLGYYSLLVTFAANDRDDLVWRLVASDEPGTWGYWISGTDATTAPEYWMPDKQKGSLNHPMLAGGLSAWLFRGLGGVRPLVPGYARIGIKPFFAPGMDSVSVSVDSPRGIITSSWKRNSGCIELSIIIPVNATAEVSIPCSGTDSIIVNGAETGDSWDDTIKRHDKTCRIFKTGSGGYTFKFKEQKQ